MAQQTPIGYVPNSSGEWYTIAQNAVREICTDLNISPPRFDRQEFAAAVFAVMAEMMGLVDDAAGTVYDAYLPTNLTGNLLQEFAALMGVAVNEGTKSTVTLTVGAWDRGAVLLSKGMATASDGTNNWVAKEDILIPANGTATGVFEASAVGAIAAAASTIVYRVSGEAGWISVNNAAAATLGTAADTDSIIRSKIQTGYGSLGSRSPLAVEAALLRINDVTAARVYYNDRTTTSKPVGGQTIPAQNVAVFVYPSTLTTEVQSEVASEIFARLGIVPTRYVPPAGSADGVRAEFDSTTSSQTFVEGFWWMPDEELGVRVQFQSDGSDYENGGYFGLVEEPTKQAVRNYFSGLRAGDIVRVQEIIAAIVESPFIGRCEVELSTNGGSSWFSVDYAVDEVTFPVIDETAFIVQEV